MIDRRTLLLSGSVALAACTRPAASASPAAAELERIRGALGPGARLGVAALDTGSGRRIQFDGDSRYAMCSTFKIVLAAAILAEVDRGRRSLGEELAFGRSDLVDHAPVVTAGLDRGRLDLETLCAAIVEVSDNAAANLLLREIGGPAGLTAFIRRCGDRVTRLDRFELDLNTNIPGDPRDTTSPAAMLDLTRTLLLGRMLAPASRVRLAMWMERSSTGRDRLRAGFPAAWRAGDKTGTGNGANNDVAIAWPPGGAPILVTSYIDSREAQNSAKNAAHAAVARVVASGFG